MSGTDRPTVTSRRPDQGLTYAAFVTQQLSDELERRAAVDERGNRAFTVSGLLIGLTVTLGVWTADKPKNLGLPRTLGALAVIAFVIAAVFGLLATRPTAYKVVDEDEIASWLRDRWDDTETTARSRVAQYQVLTLTSLRTGTQLRYRHVAVAVWVQLTGLVLVSVAVAIGL